MSFALGLLYWYVVYCIYMQIGRIMLIKEISPHPSKNRTPGSAFARLVKMSDWCTDARKFHPIIHASGGAGEPWRGKPLNVANKKCREMFVYVAENDYLCIKLGNIYTYAYAWKDI